MLAKQRYAKILDIINESGVVYTTELVKIINVSSETIRKDLKYLDEKGYISRVHGGAVAINNNPIDEIEKQYIDFEKRQNLYIDRKISIAKRAAELVQEGQSVALDPGTSNFELAKILKEKFNRLTIVTNSLKNALEFADKSTFTVIVTGGVLMADEYSFVSDFSSLILDKLNIDVMFLTVSGISSFAGFTDQRIDEVLVQNKMRSVSQKVIALADSSKFGKASLVRICGLEDVDTIITDSEIDNSIKDEIINNGVPVIIA